MIERVAITGATGFIGWHVCERFRDAGSNVVAVVRPGNRKPLPAGVERVAADLETRALTRVLGNVSAVVHLAGIMGARSIEEYRRVNVDGTREVAEAARELDTRLIYVSSLTVAGPAPADRPKVETDVPAPITNYGRSKMESEQVVRGTADLRWTIIRPAAVYGPRDRQWLPLFAAGRRGLFLRASNANTFSLTVVHADDVARAIEMACRSADVDGETLFIGHPTPVSLDGLLRTLAQIFNRRYRPLPVPLALARAAAWLGIGGMRPERVLEMQSPGFVCRVDRAEQLLGFRAQIDLADGFRSTAAWYLENRWLS